MNSRKVCGQASRAALAHHPSDLAPRSAVGDSGQLRRHGSRWCGVVGGIATVAAAIGEDIRGRLPRQHKAQREGLALPTATMLDVRSANLMELAASLPRAAGRTCATSGSAGSWATR